MHLQLEEVCAVSVPLSNACRLNDPNASVSLHLFRILVTVKPVTFELNSRRCEANRLTYIRQAEGMLSAAATHKHPQPVPAWQVITSDSTMRPGAGSALATSLYMSKDVMGVYTKAQQQATSW